MKTTLSVLSFLLFLFASIGLSAQDGVYDTRFEFAGINCVDSLLYIDIEIKAKDAGSEFDMSDQNYRFSFNSNAIQPNNMNAPASNQSVFVETEFLSGFVIEGSNSSFFNPHTLTGTVDTIVSYNIVLAGGDGYPVKELIWTKVGRLALRIIDFDECVDLKWHDSQPQNFPPTFISEKTTSGVLLQCGENFYGNFADCIQDCISLPIELASFEGTAENCNVDLSWTTLTEIDNDHFLLERSYDGNHYTQIAKIPGSGNSIEPINYTFIDRASGYLNYYRLTQVDLNGNTETFDIIQVKTACEKQIVGISELFPNPVSNDVNNVTIKFLNQVIPTNPKLHITTIDGKLITEQPVTLANGINILEYDTKDLSTGVYFIHIQDTDWRSTTKKLVKLD